MPIKFKAIQKGEPGVKGGGKKQYYAVVTDRREMDLEQLSKAVSRSSTVSGADIRAVLYASVEEATDALSEGFIVRLGDLGSLRINISSEGAAKEADVTANLISGARIVFTPGDKLKEALNNLHYEKAS